MMNACIMHACRSSRPTPSLPLTPISFEVLLALLDGDLHGYAILQAVEARLSGKLPLRTGTMYRALARLLDEELIERVRVGAAEDDPTAPQLPHHRRTGARRHAPKRAGWPTRWRRLGPTGCFRSRGNDAVAGASARCTAPRSWPTRPRSAASSGGELERVFEQPRRPRRLDAPRARCSPATSLPTRSSPAPPSARASAGSARRRHLIFSSHREQGARS